MIMADRYNARQPTTPKEIESQEIKKQTRTFLSSGGRINQVPRGKSGYKKGDHSGDFRKKGHSKAFNIHPKQV